MTTPAAGSMASQLALIDALARYDRAERLAGWFPGVPDLGRAADSLHAELLMRALDAGFEPGRGDGHLTTVAWSRKRADLIRNTFPAHVAEAQRRAA